MNAAPVRENVSVCSVFARLTQMAQAGPCTWGMLSCPLSFWGFLHRQSNRDGTMSEKAGSNETLGAWVIHHGRKLQSDQHGAAEFSAIDGAAKSGLLLAGMSASEEVQLSEAQVSALAKRRGKE